jgi:hypothetical protein
MQWSDTTAGAVGASASIIGGAVAVFTLAFTATGGPRWLGDGGPEPQKLLVIRSAPRARHRPAHMRLHALRVTRPVTLPARPARPARARRAPIAHPIRARVQPVAHRHRAARHRTPAPAVTAPVSPVATTPAAPAAPVPEVKHEKKIPPGRLKKLATGARIPPGQLKKLGAGTAVVGQTPGDEGDRGGADRAGGRRGRRARAG